MTRLALVPNPNGLVPKIPPGLRRLSAETSETLGVKPVRSGSAVNGVPKSKTSAVTPCTYAVMAAPLTGAFAAAASTAVPSSVVSGSATTVTPTGGAVPVLPTESVAPAVNDSDVTPAGTVNSTSNGAAVSVARRSPLTNTSTRVTGTRFAASMTIGIVAPAVRTAPGAGPATASVGGGPGTTVTVLVHTPAFCQPS